MGAEELERIAKALADDRRFGILEAIAKVDELSCRDLVEALPIAQATVSHHLKELRMAGLIAVRQEGQAKYFRLCPEQLEEYMRSLNQRLLRKRAP